MLNIRGLFDLDLQPTSFRILSGVLQGRNEVLRQVTLFGHSDSLVTKHKRYLEGALKRNKEKQVAFLSQCLQQPAGFLPVEFPVFGQFTVLGLEMLFDFFPQPVRFAQYPGQHLVGWFRCLVTKKRRFYPI